MPHTYCIYLIAILHFSIAFFPRKRSWKYDKLILFATEMSVEEVQDAMFPNVSRYEPLYSIFQYYKDTNGEFPNRYDYNDHCVRDLVGCDLDTVMAKPVCGFNKYTTSRLKSLTTSRYRITHSFASYCALYYDNCRRGYRAWRLLGKGKCDDDGSFDLGFFDEPTYYPLPPNTRG